MAYVISDACTNCGACESDCPASAISEKNGKRFIDPGACVSCGVCSETCPVTAITEA